MTAAAVLFAAAAAWLVIRPPPGVAAAPPAGGAETWLPALVPLAVVTAMATGIAGPAALVGGGALVAGRALLRARERRRTAAVAATHLLDACELMSAELGAGQPPGRALRRAADAWPHLAPVAEAADLGGDVPQALRRAASERGRRPARGGRSLGARAPERRRARRGARPGRDQHPR